MYSLYGLIHNRFKFTVSYTAGQSESIVEAVGIGIILLTHNQIISIDELARQTARMHYDIQNTNELLLYSVPTQEGYKFVVGHEFLLDEPHTVGEMDILFDILIRVAPQVYGQFCTPKMLVFQPQRAN
jgi:hypothetical protein